MIGSGTPQAADMASRAPSKESAGQSLPLCLPDASLVATCLAFLQVATRPLLSTGVEPNEAIHLSPSKLRCLAGSALSVAFQLLMA